MQIKTNDYSISYDPDAKTIACQGTLRLIGMEEYAPIVELFDRAIAQSPEKIIVNLQDLQFLNSSGINVISKFVLKVRQQGNMEIAIQGAKNIPWQTKS